MLWQAISPPDNQQVQELKQELKIPEEIAYLLIQRGISNYNSAKAYFRPSWEQLHDPFTMADIEH